MAIKQCFSLLLIVLLQAGPGLELRAQEASVATALLAAEATANVTEQPEPASGETTQDTDAPPRFQPVEEALTSDDRPIQQGEKLVDCTAIVSPASDMPQEQVVKLIDTLKTLGIDQVSLKVNRETQSSLVTIVCSEDVTWRRVREISEKLHSDGDFKVVMQMAGTGPVGLLEPPADDSGVTVPAEPFVPDSSQAANATAPADIRTVRVFPLRFAEAGTVGDIVEVMLSSRGLPYRIVPDPRTNSVLVTGNQEVFELCRQLIDTLDVAGTTLTPPPNGHDQGGAVSFEGRRIDGQTAQFEEAKLSVFPLEHAGAMEVWDTVSRVMQDAKLFLAFDGRTNRVLLFADEATTRQATELLKRLDTPASRPQPDSSDSSPAAEVPTDSSSSVNGFTFRGVEGAYDLEHFTFYVGFAGQSVDELRSAYEDLERKAQNLAGQLRGPLPDPATGDRLQKQLRDTVQEAFSARQKLQRAELAEFARRMQGIQQSIETREKIRDQIIDRRVEELLTPALDWDSSQGGGITAPRNTTTATAPVIEGVIVSRNEQGVVEISLGTDDGIRPGTLLNVHDSLTLAGQIEVVTVNADASVARILSDNAERPIRKGDLATNRIPQLRNTATPGNPRTVQLSELQGKWQVVMRHRMDATGQAGGGETVASAEATIASDLVSFTETSESSGMSFVIHLGESGNPQPVDLEYVFGADDIAEIHRLFDLYPLRDGKPVALGIVERVDNGFRFCIEHLKRTGRPRAFAVGATSIIWELQPLTAAGPLPPDVSPQPAVGMTTNTRNEQADIWQRRVRDAYRSRTGNRESEPRSPEIMDPAKYLLWGSLGVQVEPTGVRSTEEGLFAGLRVTSVRPGSPAELSDIRVDDAIFERGKEQIRQDSDLLDRWTSSYDERRLKLTIWSKDRILDREVRWPEFAADPGLNGEWQLETIFGKGIQGHETGLKLGLMLLPSTEIGDCYGLWTLLRGDKAATHLLRLNTRTQHFEMTPINDRGETGEPYIGLWKIEGDELKVAFASTKEPQRRPTGFDGEFGTVQVWKRVPVGQSNPTDRFDPTDPTDRSGPTDQSDAATPTTQTEAARNIDPADGASPQAVLNAMKRYGEQQNHAGFVSLLSDEEAARTTGMMLQAATGLSLVTELIEKTSQSDANPDLLELKKIMAVVERYTDEDPDPKAQESFQQIARIAEQQMAAQTPGTEIPAYAPPDWNLEQYSLHLRTAARVITDQRAFLADIMKAINDFNPSPTKPQDVEWTLEVGTSQATATAKAGSANVTTLTPAKVTLKPIDGTWRITSLIPDESLQLLLDGVTESGRPVARSITVSEPDTSDIAIDEIRNLPEIQALLTLLRDPNSADQTKLLREAADACGRFYNQHRSELAGLHARLIEARYMNLLGERLSARGILNELLDTSAQRPELEAFHDKVRKDLDTLPEHAVQTGNP